MKRIVAHQGMLCHLISRVRPDLVKVIAETGRVETAVVGLGRQGTRHALLMRDFGTTVTAGVAAGRGGQRVGETIPIYDNIGDCLEVHPHIAAVSIWRHYATARAATIEVIEAGVPLVVLISEGIALRDVRDILVAARRRGTVLIGPNTPGVIFPPEGIKVGMLPDVFYPAEPQAGQAGPAGVTIVSRSGAILYHLSDALASVGVAENAVLGVGGDGAIGSTFRDLVPQAMAFEHTELVVVAGEIGGAQEELLAADLAKHPERYPKPLVVLISGEHAPAGKTMGHAGAIVSPGQARGTFSSKRDALAGAGVTVVGCQRDLIEAVEQKLGGKRYFDVGRYRAKMKTTWEEAPKKSGWGTLITRVAPNSLLISGYPLERLVERCTLIEAAHLLCELELPQPGVRAALEHTAGQAASLPAVAVARFDGEDLSAALARCLLTDQTLRAVDGTGKGAWARKTCFALGRVARYLAELLDHQPALDAVEVGEPFGHHLYRALTGEAQADERRARMIEAMIVASVDHGATPPSAQATLIAASVRADFAVAVASGVAAITDVHGGAGAKAAAILRRAAARAQEHQGDRLAATRAVFAEHMASGGRIEGLGHRVHSRDPRRDVLWTMADASGVAGDCVAASKIAGQAFEQLRGMSLPINVDGVIGAICADMDLGADAAKALFIFGRVAGLSAHYFEEVASQPPMRRIHFAAVEYRGPDRRELPAVG